MGKSTCALYSLLYRILDAGDIMGNQPAHFLINATIIHTQEYSARPIALVSVSKM